MKTPMQIAIESYKNDGVSFTDWFLDNYEILLDKEKEQIQKAFSDGQETPINHPTLPHYSREEYYNDNYNN